MFYYVCIVQRFELQGSCFKFYIIYYYYYKHFQTKKIQPQALPLCAQQSVLVSDVINKAEMWGTSIKYITSQSFSALYWYKENQQCCTL